MDLDQLYNLLFREKEMLEKNIKTGDTQLTSEINRYYYRDEEYRRIIRSFLGRLCFEKYNFDNMREAFALPDIYPYYKRQEIYGSLPFCVNDKHYISDINVMVPFTGPQPSYNNVIDLAREYAHTAKYDDLFTKMKNFMDDNPNLRKSTRKRYDGYVAESQRLYDANRNKMDSADYQKYCDEYTKKTDDVESKIDYMSNLCGKVGEYIIYEFLQDKYNLRFVARDLGDGFGYDIYYQEFINGRYVEKLVEVKSTQDYSDGDLLKITFTEMGNVYDCLHSNNVDFTVYRLFIPKDDEHRMFLFFLQYNELEKIFSNPERTLVYKRGDTDFLYKNMNGL